MVTWKHIKPYSIKSRKSMKRKYGRRCFLEPRRHKYPVCNKYNGKEECMGHQAAQYYLSINIGKTKKKRDKQSRKKLQKYLKLKNKSKKFTTKKC